MYLTAHHVKARNSSTGINAYLSRHSAADAASINWESPDIAKIAEKFAAKVIVQSIEINPGGNAVLSYLDVVAPDDADPGFLIDSLRFFEHHVKEGRYPAVMASHRIAMRFGVTAGLQPLAVAEFRRLRARAMQLLGVTSESKIRHVVPRTSGPIRVLVTRDGAAEEYQLSRESAARVAVIRPEFGAAVRIRVSDETKADLHALVGEFYLHMVMSLTGLSSAQLGKLGGVEVVKDDSVLWQMEPADDLPGQVLGVWIRGDEPLPTPEHAPTGAILPRRNSKFDADLVLALDLVQVQDTWLPLSEAGVYTYSHSTGLVAGERCGFVTKPSLGSAAVVFDVKIAAEKLSLAAVEKHYGPTAADRARPDYQTIELELRRRA